MSTNAKSTLRRSKRIQQKKCAEPKQPNNKEVKLQEDKQYFTKAFQSNDGKIHIARVMQVSVRGVLGEASTVTSKEPERSPSVMPNISKQRPTKGSAVSQNKKQEKRKLAQKKRKKPNKKGATTPVTLSHKAPVAQLLHTVTKAPYEDRTSISQSFNLCELSAEIPSTNSIRQHKSNSNDQSTHRHLVNIPNSATVLNHVSDRNNTSNATGRYTFTPRHQHSENQCHPQCQVHHNVMSKEPANQFCGHNCETMPVSHPINNNQKPTISQVSGIKRNRVPGWRAHNVTHTQEAPAVLQTSQTQNSFSDPPFQRRPEVSSSQCSCSIHNPSIHLRGNMNQGYCNHSRTPFSSNSTSFHSQMTSCPVQQAPPSNNCQNIHHVNQSLPTGPSADLATLLLSQKSNIVQHIVHYSNTPISTPLPESAGHQTWQNKRYNDNNIISPGLRQGISSQATATSQVSSCNKYNSQYTKQQPSNSNGQHTIFFPFPGNIPIEIEIN